MIVTYSSVVGAWWLGDGHWAPLEEDPVTQMDIININVLTGRLLWDTEYHCVGNRVFPDSL